MIKILLLIAAVQGIIVGLFVLFNRKFRQTPARCLGVLTLVMSFNLLQPLLHFQNTSFPDWAQHLHYWLRYLHAPWFFFFMPLLFAFLESYTDIIAYSKKYMALAASFYVIGFGLSSYWIITDLDYQTLQSHLWKLRAGSEMLGALYSLFIWRKMIVYFNNHRNVYPSGVQRWFRHSLFILIAVFMLWIVAVISNYYAKYDSPFNFDLFYQLLRLTVAVLVYWIFYVGFFKIITSRPTTKTTKKDFSEDEKILQRIIEEELYTDPYLNVEKMAKKLGISTSHLRQVIKHHFDGTFTEYINRLRIEKAKDLLSHPDYVNYTFQAIGEEAGFNSRSTFYRCFKKITGFTPRDFKEKLQSGSNPAV